MIVLPDDEDPREKDFWEYNPQLSLLREFASVLAMDEEFPQPEGCSPYSSRVMWAVFFESDPDEERNRFMRLTKSELREHLGTTLFDDSLAPKPYDRREYMDALVAYDKYCMNAAARAMQTEIRSMQARAKVIAETELTIDESVEKFKVVTVDQHSHDDPKTNKPVYVKVEKEFFDGYVTRKGTAKEIEAMRKATPALKAKYDEIEASYRKDRAVIVTYANQVMSDNDDGFL